MCGETKSLRRLNVNSVLLRKKYFHYIRHTVFKNINTCKKNSFSIQDFNLDHNFPVKISKGIINKTIVDKQKRFLSVLDNKYKN